jgi:hypothetical protein
MIVYNETEREELHKLMEERLEKILNSMVLSKHKKKTMRVIPCEPANREKAQWNLSEIPILFGG